MNRSFLVAAGGLLLGVALLILFLHMTGNAEAGPTVVWVLVAVFGIPGCVLIAVGLSSPFDAEFAHLVRRKYALRNLLLGPVVVVVSAVILYVSLWVLPIVPDAMPLTAMLGILAGIFLTASLKSDACVRCETVLDAVTLQFANEPAKLWDQLSSGLVQDVVGRLGEPCVAGKFTLSFHACLNCKSLAVCRSPQNKIIVLSGLDASALSDLAAHRNANRNRFVFS